MGTAHFYRIRLIIPEVIVERCSGENFSINHLTWLVWVDPVILDGNSSLCVRLYISEKVFSRKGFFYPMEEAEIYFS